MELRDEGGLICAHIFHIGPVVMCIRDEPVVVVVTERDVTSSKAENGCTLIRQQVKIKR